MNPDGTSRFNVTAADIRSYDWQNLLAEHPERDCKTYYKVFGRQAHECELNADDLGQRVFALLNAVASFFPNFGSEMEPYRPFAQFHDGRRSLVPDDLSGQDLDTLNEIVGEIEDPEYRARVADVLWVRKRDYRAAQIAVSSFLEAAEAHKTSDGWPPYVERLERAAMISAKKGFESQRGAVVSSVEMAISEFEVYPESGLLCSRLMGILLLLGEGDPDHYIELSEKLARGFSAASEWNFAESYWRIAERWHRRNRDEGALQRSMIEASECLVERAEAAATLQPPQLGMAAHWMGKGLESLRRSRADTARIRVIHRRFITLQKEALSELKPFDFDPESIPGFTEERENVQQAVAGHFRDLDFERAVTRLALLCDPTDLEQLKEADREQSEGFIWDKVVGSNRLDRDGKVADFIPPTGMGGDPDETALRKRLVQQAAQSVWPLAVDWKIEPARRVIAAQHPIRLLDIAFLVTNNPFIREGHQGIYLRGIQAGFFGDWLVAMHLLVPQLEESIRYVLQNRGVVTSTRESDGTQKEKDINLLLWDETALEIFGPDILFDLRGILIERFGSNMRNELAHGLMHEGAFWSAESVYLWWLVIRLCWIGYRNAQPRTMDEE